MTNYVNRDEEEYNSRNQECKDCDRCESVCNSWSMKFDYQEKYKEGLIQIRNSILERPEVFNDTLWVGETPILDYLNIILDIEEDKSEIQLKLDIKENNMKECKIEILSGIENISFAYDSPACFDIHANEDVVICPGRSIIHTGIVAAIDPDYFVEIRSKSGLSLKHGIEKGAGVIDSDYRGEWIIILYRHEVGSLAPLTIKKGDKIAQATVREKIKPIFVQVDQLSETKRGEGGFGSSGV